MYQMIRLNETVSVRKSAVRQFTAVRGRVIVLLDDDETVRIDIFNGAGDRGDLHDARVHMAHLNSLMEG